MFSEEREEDSVSGDLNSFLATWREELSQRSKHGDGERLATVSLSRSKAQETKNGLLGKRGREVDDETPEVRDDGAWRREEKLREPSPIFVLPPGNVHVETERTPEKDDRKQQEREGGRHGGAGGSLVDKLIADLDEVNMIPFFDVQLPREIALIIFGCLNIKDLCACALVSSSWYSLAQDNVLWCNICHSLGHETSVDVYGHVSWKAVVREIILKRKKVERNWMERICGLSDHQPDNVGVLCCVSSCTQQALACYSSGAVHCWDLAQDRGPRFLQQVPGPFASPLPSCCSLCQGWAVVGTEEGTVRIFDTETCSLVCSQANLGSVNSVSMGTRQGSTMVAISSFHTFLQPGNFRETIHSDVKILVASEGGGGGGGGRREHHWEESFLQLPRDRDNYKVTRVELVPTQSEVSPAPFAVLYSTSTTLTLHPPHLPSSHATHILTSAGERGVNVINCFDFSSSLVACGTSAYGYHIQLFDLATGAYQNSLHGHRDQVMSINIASSPPGQLVSGSADKKVRVFDIRSPSPSLTLRGNSGPVLSVQMDQSKVVSGSLDGTMIVWDLRMRGELWRSHERHPVELCHFHGNYLLAAHVPMNKQPEVYTGNPHICHRRQRGLLRLYDFSVDPLSYTSMLPSICSSGYDEPSASFYNLDLRVPYDVIS